jgi:hypothetical protein
MLAADLRHVAAMISLSALEFVQSLTPGAFHASR